MMLVGAARWIHLLPFLLLFLLLTHDVRCQLSLGEVDAFQPEDLDASGATGVTGKDTESSSLAAASGNNAVHAASVHADSANASDPNSAGTSVADSDLTITPTDHFFDDTTNADFDDYLTDEAHMTTEPAYYYTDDLSIKPGNTDSYFYPTDGEDEIESVTSEVPQLTRRIVFSGPSVSPISPEPSVEFTRPSSVTRGLDGSNLDIWLPNWPSELLQNSGDPTRGPTIRFPIDSPTSVFENTPVPSSVLDPVSTPVPDITPSFTVSKVPVTQYYFDLTTVAPSPVPGPLFDEEDLPSSALPSIRPDISRQIMELSSSLSELQSSVLVEASLPMSITPTLSGSRETVVTEPSLVTPSALPATPVPTPTLTATSTTLMDEVMERDVVDNNLNEDMDGGMTVTESPLNETTGPRPPQSYPDPQQDADQEESENTTDGDIVDHSPTADIAGELPGTGELQYISSAATTTAHPVPTASSEIVTATSTSTTPSKRPTFTRTTQATESSRTPLWMLLSQSVPSRPVTSPPPSTQLTSSTTPTPELYTPVASALPPNDTSSPSPTAGVSTPQVLPPSSTSVPEVLVSDQSPAESLNNTSTQTPQSNDPTGSDQLDEGNGDVTTISPASPAPSSTLPPEVSSATSVTSSQTMKSDLTPGNEQPNITVTENVPMSKDAQSRSNAVVALTNSSTVQYTENIHNNSSPSSSTIEVPINKTDRENEISDEPVVITLPVDVPLHPDTPSDQGDILTLDVDPSEVGREIYNLDSSPWTPIVEQTDNDVQNIPVTTSSSVVTTTTSLVITTPPEFAGGFTPIVGETGNTNYVPQSDEDINTSHIPFLTSTTAVAESTIAATAPLDGSSTHPPAHTSNLIDSSVSTSVHMTSIESESVMPNDQSSPDHHLTSNIINKDELMPSVSLLSTAIQTSMKDESTLLSKTPSLSELLPSTPSSDTVTSETPFSSSMSDNIPEPTVVMTEPSLHTSSTSSDAELFPSLADTLTDTIHQDRYPSSELSSVTPASPVPPDMPVSSASVALLPTPPAEPNPDSHTLVVVPTVTEDSTVTPIHTVQLEPPEEGTELDTQEEVPEKEPEVVDDIMPAQPPATTTTPPPSPPPPPPVPSPLPPVNSSSPPPTTPTTPPPVIIPSQPPASSPSPPDLPPSVSSEEATPTVRGPTITTSSTPVPSVTTPTTTTTTTTETTTITPPPITTTTTTPVPTTPPTEPPTTVPTSDSPPTLTTTMMLPNGTMVDAPLPHIRALVTYTIREFCQHKLNFRTMFSQWITQHLSGQALVEPQDIKFFNMATCPPNQSSQLEDLREDLPADTPTPQPDLEETNVYFYVTTSGIMDPDLTEQFPRFPMDLDISDDLTYLRPKVRQLELVRGHGASNTDLLLEEEAAVGTSLIVIIVICSIVGVTIIMALLFFMLVKRRGATNNYYGRRCTPVSMDAYSMDSVSVYHSFRRKSKRRASGRSIKSYLNQAFDDPNGPSRPLNFAKLTHFISDIDGVHEEFSTIPINMPKYDELPAGVEDKNRYANVIPVPETRVLLKVAKDSRNSDYINANYVRSARNESKYYIATQAPLDDTVADFWRMIWEQETRVVVMLTDFVEKGIDKCADYLPPSETLDCHRVYGDFQVTLKSRDMKEKFVVSNVQLKNLENNLIREVAHMWFTGWPAAGVPNEEAGFISFILEVRRTRKRLRAKGPILVHCSPGTGRTGTLLACDIVMKQFEDQRNIDVPRTVYSIRRDRAGAVQTKEQYAFIYRVIDLYASKLTSGNLDSL
ncbi:hypothetical protein Pmani_034474 [Petrolisthes manimaculis]|uniref:protein-tyrosine-phosphatase n=1 Tax=Petrolisthes manimaculis TaxID=1843537 RepID=A0AAE1NP83_9EUCA|nr:hypothetical protein Pmani_034474 [Petrolisthes manimaculis]